MGLTPEQKKARRRAQIKERRFTIYRRITFIVLGFILVGILLVADSEGQGLFRNRKPYACAKTGTDIEQFIQAASL